MKITGASNNQKGSAIAENTKTISKLEKKIENIRTIENQTIDILLEKVKLM